MNEPQTTWGFWVGLYLGLFVGVCVFGVSVIGQGLWEAGRLWGEMSCGIKGESHEQ